MEAAQQVQLAGRRVLRVSRGLEEVAGFAAVAAAHAGFQVIDAEYEFKVEHDPKNRVVIHLHIHYCEDSHKSEEKSYLPRFGRR